MTTKYEFVTGESVRLKSGAFQLFTGSVVSVNQEERMLKVVVSVLGKWRTVELRFSEVEKVA
jgi:transcription termination/antitermination protein NusG